MPSSPLSLMKWLTPERLAKLFQDSAYADGRARGALGLIDAKSFLQGTTPHDESLSQIWRAASATPIDYFNIKSAHPYLQVPFEDQIPYILSHEGRHTTAKALQQSGAGEGEFLMLPYYIRNKFGQGIDPSKIPETMRVGGQDFGPIGSGDPLSITNILPLSYENKKAAQNYLWDLPVKGEYKSGGSVLSPHEMNYSFDARQSPLCQCSRMAA